MLDAVVTNSLGPLACCSRSPSATSTSTTRDACATWRCIAIPVLGAVGIQGLRDEPMPARRATRWLGGRRRCCGWACRWRCAPTPCTSCSSRSALSSRRRVCTRSRRAGRTWAWAAVVAVLSVGTGGQRRVVTRDRRSATRSASGSRAVSTRTWSRSRSPLPEVDAAAFTTPTAFVPRLQASTGALPHVGTARRLLREGLPVHAAPSPTGRRWRWNAARCSGSATSLGYNPVQLPRYWDYLRARTDLPVFYNAAVIDLPTSQDVGLLGHPLPRSSPPGSRRRCPATVVDRAQGYDLVELATWQPHRLGGPVVDRGGLDRPRRSQAVLGPRVRSAERGRRSSPTPGSGCRTRCRTRGSASATETERGASLHRRRAPRRRRSWSCAAAYDDGWTATVDGDPPTSLPADGFLMGCRSSAGDRTRCDLVYRDARSDAGPASPGSWRGSAFAVAVRGGRVMERRRRRAAASRRPTAPTSGAGAPMRNARP